MTTMKPISMLAVPVLLALCGACGACGERPGVKSVDGRNTCPESVTQSVAKELPGATLKSCKAEKDEGGHDQFEVTLEQATQKIEVDVAPDGRILQTETIIAVTDVPAKVMAAFSAKYPGAKSTRAEKQVRAGKGTFYEIKFDAQPKAKEATFSEDGTFVAEE
jgi:hypothetical protein